MGGGGKGGDGGAAQARQDEMERQARIREGTASVNQLFDSQFTPDFFEKRKQAYLDYASPKLQTQYQDALKKLTYALDRSGTANSSMRGERLSELKRLYDQNQRAVADTALNQVNDAKSNIEQSRASLINQLTATSDVQNAIAQATNQSKILSEQQGYSPLSQLFSQFTDTLGTQASLERNAYYTGTKPVYDTGLFTPKPVSIIKG